MGEIIQASDFSSMLTEIKAVIPIILPTVVGWLGFRKAWSFLKGQIKSA